MDIFHTLSSGGARFDKKRFKDDVKLFGGSASPKAGPSSSSSRKSNAEVASDKVIVPDQLDFFGSAAKSKSTVSAVEVKRKAAEREQGNSDESDSDSNSDSDSDSDGDGKGKGKKRKRTGELSSHFTTLHVSLTQLVSLLYAQMRIQ